MPKFGEHKPLPRYAGDPNTAHIPAGFCWFDTVAREAKCWDGLAIRTFVPAGPAGGTYILPQTYQIYRDGLTYYAMDADGVNAGSDADYEDLINSLLVTDGLHFHHKRATYALDGLITVDHNYQKFTWEPYSIIDCGAAGRFLLASAGANPVNGLNGLFGIEFDGNNRTVIANGAHGTFPFIDMTGFTSAHRCENLRIKDFYLYDWRTSNQVLNLSNLETSWIERNWFAGLKPQATVSANDGAFISLKSTNYNAGNVYIQDNFFNAWLASNAWITHILIQGATGGKELTYTRCQRNHSINDYHTNGAVKHIVLDSSTGVIRAVQSLFERMEGVDYWDVRATTSQIKQCEIAYSPYCDLNSSLTDTDFIHPDTGWDNRDMKIHNNTLTCFAGKNLLNLQNNGGAGYELHFYNNRILGTGGTLVANASSIWAWNNKGYGTLDQYQTQAGGAWAAPTGFAANGSRVMVYNSNLNQHRFYYYSNGGWHYVALT